MTKESFQNKTIIPYYIISYSIKTNQMILPIYLYLKKQTNRNGTVFFNYEGMFNYFFAITSNTKAERKKTIEALLFLLVGVKKKNENQVSEVSVEKTFEIDELINYNFKKMLERVTITEYEDDYTGEIRLVYELDGKESEKLIETLDKEIEVLSKKENIVKLTDLTNRNVVGFLTIETDALDYLETYSILQNKNERKLSTSLKIKKEKDFDLQSYREKYEINCGNPELSSYVNYSQLILQYVYLLRIFKINELNKVDTTRLAVSTLNEKLKLSKKAVMLLNSVLVSIGMIKITKSSFKDRMGSKYELVDTWKKNLVDDTTTVYKFSVISKKQRDKIINEFYVPLNDSNTPVKRGRGRPRKNIT